MKNNTKFTDKNNPRVKKNEEYRINYAYTNLSEYGEDENKKSLDLTANANDDEIKIANDSPVESNTKKSPNNKRGYFKPVEGVVYLWVLKQSKKKPSNNRLFNKNNVQESQSSQFDLIIGIEEPWKYPQAFLENPTKKELEDFQNYFKELSSSESSIFKKNDWKKKNKLGHPTLATNFVRPAIDQAYSSYKKDHGGKVSIGASVPSAGNAVLGGELTFVNGHWRLDDNSGRFGGENSVFYLQDALHLAAEKFADATGLQPEIKVFEPTLNDYYKVWFQKDNDFDRALHLIKKHYAPSVLSRFLQDSLNLNVGEALKEIKKEKITDLKEALTVIRKHAGSSADEDFIGMLNFIAGQAQIDLQFRINEPQANVTLESKSPQGLNKK